MKSVRVKSLAVGAVLILALAAAVPGASFAGETISFKQRFPNVNLSAGRCNWRQAASISLNAPSGGVVVVTASGMVFFDTFVPASVTFTLDKTSASKGSWIFTTSPGVEPYQTYTVRMVFNVAQGPNTFFLNARSCDGDGNNIGIQTGSMTAEFYANANIEQVPAPAARSADTEPSGTRDLRRN